MWVAPGVAVTEEAIRPLTEELPYATGVTLKKKKKDSKQTRTPNTYRERGQSADSYAEHSGGF